MSPFDWNAEARLRCEGMRTVDMESPSEGTISDKSVLKEMLRTELYRSSDGFDSDIFEECIETIGAEWIDDHARIFFEDNYRR